jgi:hypothetical protein
MLSREIKLLLAATVVGFATVPMVAFAEDECYESRGSEVIRCEVTGNPPPEYDYTQPTPPGSLPPGYYDPDDNNGGNEPPPPVCLELFSKGVPEDCSREMLSSGHPLQNFQPPNMHRVSQMGSTAQWWMTSSVAGLAAELYSCYSDISQSPGSCESTYYNAFASMQPYAAGWGPSDYLVYIGIMTDLYYAIAVANENRMYASWFGNAVETYTFYNIGLNLGGLGWLLTLDQFNQALIGARQFKECDLFFQYWDGYNCSNY